MISVLLIGSGGREHAIALKLSESPQLGQLYCAPGNPGTATLGTNVPIADTDLDGLLRFAKEMKIDLTVVGPEAPLVVGIVDLFEASGCAIVGPQKAAALLEGSKAFSKDVMKKYGIPTAASLTFTDSTDALDHVRFAEHYPVVIKADGLAAGKGVVVAVDFEQAELAICERMVDQKFGAAGTKIIIEDFLAGEEASVLAVTDGVTIYPLAPAQDHKAIFDGDKGPNTGGMGAYSPTPVVTSEVMEKVMNRVLRPLINGLRADGIVYKGILYAGLMIDQGEPSVVEFNVRFGDPETQAVLPRMQTDLMTVLMAIAKGRLSEVTLSWSDQACVCVVLASKGYPGDFKKGIPISGILEADEIPGCHVVQAGTKMGADGQLRSAGGRVLGVVGLGPTIAAAQATAYKGVDCISFENKYCRRDIGWKAL